MKSLFLVLVAFLITNTALGGHKRMPQDIVLPSQKVLEYEKIDNAAAADADGILNDNAGAVAAAAVTVSSFLTQPDVPRNITVTPVGTTADVAAGSVVITGKDHRGVTITESLAFLANASTATVGAKAFKSITSITFPAEDSPYGALWDVGWGNKLGLKACMDSSQMMIKGWIASTAETITTTADATALSSNGFTPTNVPDASRDYEVLYIQNFRCVDP